MYISLSPHHVQEEQETVALYSNLILMYYSGLLWSTNTNQFYLELVFEFKKPLIQSSETSKAQFLLDILDYKILLNVRSERPV